MSNTRSIEEIIALLKNGGVVILPTDTAFALSCRIDDEKAVKRLFAIKQRENTQATPILVRDTKMVEEYTTQIMPEVRKLMQNYWPGALTIVLPANKEKVLPLVRGSGDTIGVRQPKHESCLQILKELGVPLVGTSANFHGYQTPYTLLDIDSELLKKVDGILPGVCSHRMVSTIVDATKNPLQIIRKGPIDISL